MMAATTSTYIHLHDDDQIDVDTFQGQARVRFGNNAMFLQPAVARRLAAHLLAAAEHVDPDTADTNAIARTLAIATGGAA